MSRLRSNLLMDIVNVDVASLMEQPQPCYPRTVDQRSTVNRFRIPYRACIHRQVCPTTSLKEKSLMRKGSYLFFLVPSTVLSKIICSFFGPSSELVSDGRVLCQLVELRAASKQSNCEPLLVLCRPCLLPVSPCECHTSDRVHLF